MEEEKSILKESGKGYPVLIIPKRCTMLETDCDATDNVFIDINITSFDPSGDQAIIYSGYCNVKIIEDTDVDDIETSSDQFDSDNVLGEITVADTSASSNDCSLVDPMNTPYLNKDHDGVEEEQRFSCTYETHEGCVTVTHHNIAIMNNLYNYSEAVQSSPLQYELNRSGGAQRSNNTPQPLDPSFEGNYINNKYIRILHTEI